MKKIFKIDYRYYVVIIITILLLLLHFQFPHWFSRLIIAIKDFGLSLAYYFIELFELPFEIKVTVNDIPEFIKEVNISFFPENWELFKIKLGIYFKSLFNFETLLFYLSDVQLFLKSFYKLLLLILPFGLLIYVFYIDMFSLKKGKLINEDSLRLKRFKSVEKKIFKPIKDWIISLYHFILKRKKIYIIWFLILSFYFNWITILIELIAYYFYFVISFDLINVYIQVYKLILDLIPMINFVPSFLWIIMFLILFNRYRKKKAFSRLQHFEMRNRGVINTMGQVTLICGTMGKGKTKLMTDFVLSQSIMFRKISKEKLLEKSNMFPNFPFIKFELEIKRAIKYHEIYNLATAELFVNKKNERFFKDKTDKLYFDYDIKNYPFEFNNGLIIVNLFEMLVDYAKLYFVYYIQSSLIIGNYAVREDNVFKDLGFFPLWEDNLFDKDPNEQLYSSYYSHIIDFDMLRLGMKMVENNEYSDCLEFGIIDLTEGGKERGNAIENRGLKKEASEANQNNDMFNLWLKMARHKATIDNYPFIKIFIDEQRPESLGADAREVCDKIVYIEEKYDVSNILMFFSLEWIFYDLFSSIYNRLLLKYRYYRGDNNLFIYLLKKIFGFYFKYFIPLYNTYGFYKIKLSTQKGTMDSSIENMKYYMMFKKIHSNRYSSDAFSDYFRKKSLNSNYGINDIVTYKSERATIEELESQNSYFIRDLTKNIGVNKNENNKK